MTDLIIRPYLLRNRIQNYAWGTKGSAAFIPRLLGEKPLPEVPYAELWMGAHPSAPSEIDLNGAALPLDKAISRFPRQMLGEYVAQKFGPQLPFLFKVLSAGEALSIQAHPNKEQAKILHARDPQHYPDANHKPEIAIALTSFTALVGFKQFFAIMDTLQNYPEIADFIGTEIIAKMRTAENHHFAIKLMFSRLIERSLAEPQALHDALARLAQRLNGKNNALTEIEKLFLELRQKYGTDIGLFSLFLLNLIHLKKGEGIFLAAGVPHAYIKGDIVECMANSDNVVRAGLTPKFKDMRTLLEILTYDAGEVEILDGDFSVPEFIYEVPVQEFRVVRWLLPAGAQKIIASHNSPHVILVISGEVISMWGKNRITLTPGKSIFIPAAFSQLKITVRTPALLFKVDVPIPSGELKN